MPEALLVNDNEIYDYLDLDPDEDPNKVLLSTRDAVEKLLIEKTSRQFGPSVVLTDESYDGPGSHLLYLNRPLTALTAIKFRYAPEVTLDQYFNLDITMYVTWKPGTRRIHSRAYEFPCGYDNILVSYTTAADQPEIAKQAVREATAMFWRSRGSEDARSEQMGTFQHVMKRKIEESLFWQNAIEALHLPVLG